MIVDHFKLFLRSDRPEACPKAVVGWKVPPLSWVGLLGCCLSWSGSGLSSVGCAPARPVPGSQESGGSGSQASPWGGETGSSASRFDFPFQVVQGDAWGAEPASTGSHDGVAATNTDSDRVFTLNQRLQSHCAGLARRAGNGATPEGAGGRPWKIRWPQVLPVGAAASGPGEVGLTLAQVQVSWFQNGAWTSDVPVAFHPFLRFSAAAHGRGALQEFNLTAAACGVLGAAHQRGEVPLEAFTQWHEEKWVFQFHRHGAELTPLRLTLFFQSQLVQ
jgi:hypothetical protein